jgi:hypothetical protein
MATQTGLVCPKCGGRMQGYERTHVFVEQCEECRGIFLDHGELERLIDAEGGGWSGVVEPPTEKPADARPARGRAGQSGRKSAKRHEETLRDLFGDED